MYGKTEQDRLAKVSSGNDDLRTMPAWLHVSRTRWHLTSCSCRKCARPNKAFALSALLALTAEYSAVGDIVCGTEVSFKLLAHVFRHSVVHDFVKAAYLLYSICEMFFSAVQRSHCFPTLRCSHFQVELCQTGSVLCSAFTSVTALAASVVSSVCRDYILRELRLLGSCIVHPDSQLLGTSDTRHPPS